MNNISQICSKHVTECLRFRYFIRNFLRAFYNSQLSVSSSKPQIYFEHVAKYGKYILSLGLTSAIKLNSLNILFLRTFSEQFVIFPAFIILPGIGEIVGRGNKSNNSRQTLDCYGLPGPPPGGGGGVLHMVRNGQIPPDNI